MLKSLDYFFVLRPMLFFPGWSTLLAGYLITSKSQIVFTKEELYSINYPALILLMLAFAAAMGGSFLLNQLQDMETDLRNKKLFLLSEKYISPKKAWTETTILLFFALALAIYIHYSIFIVILVFILITAFAYNFEPLALKNKPVGSLAANTAMGWLAFAAGWFAVNKPNPDIVIDSLPYLFFNTALYFFTTLPDVSGDQSSNKNTLAVKMGFKAVILMASGSYVLSIISGIISEDKWALIFILASLPFFIMVFFKQSVESTVKTTKYAILFFAIAICLKIPFYFILMITIFMATRWYFKLRFNYDYPNFKGE